ncbi:MAG: ester cyclase [Steroidobacteraceae bacterium]
MKRALALGLMVFLFGAHVASSEEMTNHAKIVCDGQEGNRDQYLRMWQVLFMERDASRVAEFYASQVVSHNSDAGGAGSVVTSEQLAQFWSLSKKVNPERVLDDELIICSGDYVVVRTLVRSTDKMGMFGQPPTGKSYSTTAIDIYRFVDGKVVERWGNSDLVSIAQQLGYEVAPRAETKAAPEKK